MRKGEFGMSGWEFTINSGNPEVDRTTVETYRQQTASQGMTLQVTPLPTGGFHLRAVPGGAPQAGYGQQPGYGQPQQQAYGQQASYQQQQPPPAQQQPWQQAQAAYAAGAGAGGVAVGEAAAPVAMTQERVRYLRKVYGLLFASMAVAILAGWACTNLGPEEAFKYRGHKVMVPIVVATFLNAPVLMYASFGVLVGATFVASWVSKVKGLNVAMLMLVGALMGLELAPMVFVAQVYGSFGDSLSSAPVRDAGMMVFGIFASITGYVFVTKKDFSYMKAMLSMGFVVVFIACLLTFVFQSEIFSLAVATVGALLAAGFLLYETSYIFRNSEMDDPVEDALCLIVQLRNLFMFLLRIFMSRGD
jgi:modulator of FtsH protease